MDILKKVVKQASWQLLAKAGTSLSTLFILRLVTQNYHEYGTGVFTLALTYLSYFVFVVDFGFNALVIQEFTEQKSVASFRKLLGLRLLHTTCLLILSLVLVSLWPNNEPVFKQLVYIGAFVALFESAIFVTCNAIFQYKLRYDLATVATLIGVVFTTLGAYWVINSDLPLPYLMLSYVAGWIVMAIVALFGARKYINSLSPIFDLQYFKSLFQKVWPISLTLLLNVIYFRFDAFVLTWLKGFAEVGIYNVAYAVFQSALVIPAFIMNGFYPLMLESFTHDKRKFVQLLMRSCGIMLALGTAATIFTWYLSPFIIELLKGFPGSVESLKILSLGFPAFFVSAVLMWTSITLKKYKTMIGIYAIGLTANVALNLLLIPQYSYIASSYITGISEYLILILQVLILWKALKI